MKVTSFQFNPFGVNTYIVVDETSREAAVIDPGMSNEQECDIFKRFVDDAGIKVTSLINTHLHIDHTLGNEFVENQYGVGLTAHPADEFLGRGRAQQAAMFGLRGVATSPVVIAHEVKQGDTITVGNGKLRVLEVPGHSPGSIALWDDADSFVITGDALFRGSIGRTDLPGGNHQQLIKAVTDRLLTLPHETVVYPGHGPASTIGEEMRSNPYL